MATRFQVQFVNKYTYQPEGSSKLKTIREKRLVYVNTDGHPSWVLPEIAAFMRWKYIRTHIAALAADYIYYVKKTRGENAIVCVSNPGEFDDGIDYFYEIIVCDNVEEDATISCYRVKRSYTDKPVTIKSMIPYGVIQISILNPRLKSISGFDDGNERAEIKSRIEEQMVEITHEIKEPKSWSDVEE